jgi:hypothetical protein
MFTLVPVNGVHISEAVWTHVVLNERQCGLHHKMNFSSGSDLPFNERITLLSPTGEFSPLLVTAGVIRTSPEPG